ncbi:helix-turn-helix domain-containing protein [Gluconobacter japonicus]|uniref:helix-turn-helix domain-containing protein n=1 Tax=Gluconobacter japonicus TaxID=376620 RepID=UPI000C082A8A|nr:helix-turn-helix domain-containing protein [Gluconobacter japonicus]GBR27880.1 hypothetical protein AA3271_2671 [Gluconobacter japonicus NBRC 3271]
MENLTEIIAKKVFSARSNAELEIKDLSKMTNIRPKALISIESGQYRPTPKELMRLISALEINPSNLLS